MRKFSIFSMGLGVIAGIMIYSSAVMAAEDEGTIIKRDWTFSGLFGHYDRASLQRGFQVYREVCSSCHGLDYIAFRNLADLGYNEDEIKSIAAEYEIVDGPDEEGEFFTRSGVPADKLPNPFPNENAARAANGGAYPPDLSLTVKANANGADYIYSLLTSYKDAPVDVNLPDGMHYNEAFTGRLIAMPQPLYGDDITLAGEGDASIEGLAADVTSFLAWTAEPEMETRKRIGIAVMVFLLAMCFISYGSMRYVWSDVKK
jgi:ubiquinol-cytochrome c reductase cytochrome c1 subunit